jgi:hypothetical protein
VNRYAPPEGLRYSAVTNSRDLSQIELGQHCVIAASPAVAEFKSNRLIDTTLDKGVFAANYTGIQSNRLSGLLIRLRPECNYRNYLKNIHKAKGIYLQLVFKLMSV